MTETELTALDSTVCLQGVFFLFVYVELSVCGKNAQQ